MLQAMRAKAQGVGSKIVIGLIIFTLSAFGFGSFSFFQARQPLAASVNGEEISRVELERQTQIREQDIRDEFGDEYVDELAPGELSRLVLTNLIRTVLIQDYGADLGLVASATQVDEEIVNQPAFMLDEQFSPEIFRQRALSQGLTPEALRQEIAKSLETTALQSSLLDSAVLTEGEIQHLVELVLERRDIAWLEFQPALFVDQVEVSDEEITTAYELRRAEFMTEARIDAQYMELRLQDLAALEEFAPDEAALREVYDAELAEYTVPEQRDASHILLEVNDERSEADAIAELADIRSRVLAGESFEEIAREVSDDVGTAEAGGSLGAAGRGAYVPAFEDALWALAEEGAFSEPVVSEFGVHLIRLNEILEERVTSFEERREDIESDLRLLAAGDRFSEMKLQADDLAFDAQNSLMPLSEAFDLPLLEVAGVTREAGEQAFAEAALRDALFAADVMDSGFNSPLIEVGEDSAYVLRAAEVYQAEQIPLDEVRADLRTEIELDRAMELASQAARDAKDRMLDGEGAASIALEEQTWEKQDRLQRGGAGVPEPIVRTAFELPRPSEGYRSLDVVSLDDGVSALMVVTRVEDGDTSEFPESEIQGLEDQVRQLASRRDIVSLLADLTDVADIESDLLDG